MKTTTKTVATIKLDDINEQRGFIKIIEDIKYIVVVELPDGEIEDPGLPIFESENDAKLGISDNWGNSPLWDLIRV